jgi:hypothetical protein
MKLVWPHDIWARWQRWAHLAGDCEVSAMGRAEWDGCDFRVTGLVLCDQEVTTTTTTITAAGRARSDYELRDTPGLVLWVHSHVQMNVFWSGTDHANLAGLVTATPHAVAAVTNLRGEVMSALVCAGVGEGCPPGLVDLATEIDWAGAEDAEWQAKVKRKKEIRHRPWGDENAKDYRAVIIPDRPSVKRRSSEVPRDKDTDRVVKIRRHKSGRR